MSKYSPEFKLQIIQEYLKLGGLKRIANRYEINTSDIRKWTLAYQAHGLPSLQKKVPSTSTRVQTASLAIHGNAPAYYS